MHKRKIILLAVSVIALFLIGYYLRAYLPLNKDLALSPYEAYTSRYDRASLRTEKASWDFSDKASRYPTTIILHRFLNPILGNFYIIYILGAIAIFFLGKEITGKNLGGFLCFSLFAISSENLLQYTRALGASGICYVFMWLSFLFLIRHLKHKKNRDICLFILFALLALTSYHTGAAALVLVLIGIFISLTYSKYLDKKIAFSILGLILFYFIWISMFDKSQLGLLTKLFIELNLLTIFYIILGGLFLFTLIYLVKDKKKFWDQSLELFPLSEYFLILVLVVSTILIFSKFAFFDSLLSLGVKNYYISTITLNNYLAQALLTHIYLLAFLPFLFQRQLDKEYAFLRGWLIGLIFVFILLAYFGYYARIFDYSFPLMFVLFGLYWCKKKRFKLFFITVTVILLILSQFAIYNDPFSMRRYYTYEEIESANNIITLNLSGKIASDLRTSALFSYLGKKDILFADSGENLHDTIFYEYQKLPNLDIEYIILSESMKIIVYSKNFPTKPIKQEVFNYYKNNYKEVYNDGLMYIYKIN